MHSLILCFDILEDVLVCCMSHQLEVMPLASLKKCLLDAALILESSSFLKFRLQIVLCLIVAGTEQTELNMLLTAEKKNLCSLMENFHSVSSADEILVLLRKIKSLAVIPANRFIMRKIEVLSILETLVEKDAELPSVVELAAELICKLLSDQPDETADENHNDLEMMEKFMNACFKGKLTPYYLLYILHFFCNQ